MPIGVRRAGHAPQHGRHRPGPQSHYGLPGLAHFPIGGDGADLALPQRDPVLGKLAGIGQVRGDAGPRFRAAGTGFVLASGVAFARIPPGVVETGLHHHAAFILLAGRIIAAAGRR
jgi:hypothetical protein